MPTATAPDPVAELNKTLAALEKRVGKGTLHWASESQPVFHLPFLNPHLNYATEGGAPWDRFVALYGDESTGKTLCGLELVAVAQDLPHSAEVALMPRIKYHRDLGHDELAQRLSDELEWIEAMFPDGAMCCWHDIEGQFDPLRAQKVGVDTDKLLMDESQVIEDICGTLGSLFSHINLHVLDSTSNATSLLSLKQDPGKSLMGTDARVWKFALRDTETFFGTKNSGIPNMVVFIHQMSTNMRTGGAQAVAGRFLRHTSSCSVKFSRGKFLWRKDGVLVEDKATGADDASMAGRAVPNGLEIYAQIEKSRTCRPFRIGSLQFDLDKLSYQPIHELAASGLYYGILVKSGTWYSVAGEENNIGQGLKTVYARLADDEELRDRIMCRLLDFTDET